MFPIKKHAQRAGSVLAIILAFIVTRCIVAHTNRNPYDYISVKIMRDLHIPFEENKFYLGIELEIQYETHTEKNNAIMSFTELVNQFQFRNWVLQNDNSVQYCIEYTSYPLSYQDMLNEIFALTEFINNTQGSTADGAGLHVHVSRASIKKYRPANMSMNEYYKYLWWKVNNINYRNDWIKLANRTTKWAVFDATSYSCIGHEQTRHYAWERAKTDRYRALNLAPIRTIEFRMFRSTLDPNKIKKYLEKVHSVITNNDDYELYLRETKNPCID